MHQSITDSALWGGVRGDLSVYYMLSMGASILHVTFAAVEWVAGLEEEILPTQNK